MEKAELQAAIQKALDEKASRTDAQRVEDQRLRYLDKGIDLTARLP